MYLDHLALDERRTAVPAVPGVMDVGDDSRPACTDASRQP